MRTLRRFAGPGIGFLFGVGLEVSPFQEVWVTVGVWTVAGLWGLLALVTWEPVKEHLPFSGFVTCETALPQELTIAELRRECLQTIEDISQFLTDRQAVEPPSIHTSMETAELYRSHFGSKIKRLSDELQKRNLAHLDLEIGHDLVINEGMIQEIIERIRFIAQRLENSAATNS